MFSFHDFMCFSVAARLLNTQSFTLPVDRNKTRKNLGSVLKTVLSEWCLLLGRPAGRPAGLPLFTSLSLASIHAADKQQ
jgi:hypothetical protein